uniref:Ig-like domain-containing protein n=1 Tax=Scleropages formosus TaxID=113540 RepID=A0A8C9T128_SCLFO
HRCWLVLTVLWNIVSADEKVEAYEGDKVILPCVFSGTNLKDVTLCWEYRTLGITKKDVYTLNVGKEDLLDQDIQFRNRTRMFPSEYAKGNFSLLLNDVKKSDNGSYLCSYVDHNFLPTTKQPESNTAEARSNIIVLLLALFGVIFNTV